VDKVHLKRVLVIFLVCIVVFSVWGVQWKTLKADFVSVDSLQPGDILFVDIYEGWCHGGFWDHLALYVGEQPYGGASVVEATFNGGVCLTPVASFLKRDEPAKVAVRRLKGASGHEEDIQKAIDYALAQVGKPFDFTATATLPAKINERNLHCVELVWRAYKAAGIDLDINDGLLIYPDEVYFSPKLTRLG
jgi:uncharacterized protein YycO